MSAEQGSPVTLGTADSASPLYENTMTPERVVDFLRDRVYLAKLEALDQYARAQIATIPTNNASEVSAMGMNETMSTIGVE